MLYEKTQYLLKQTFKPKYLDFYDINEKDLTMPEIYLNQTLRFNNKWYFLTKSKKYFYSAEERDKMPELLIKDLYKKPIALK